MKRFLKNILVLAAMVIPLLIILNYIIDHGLRKSNLGHFAEWNYIYDTRQNPDVLIMGSSKAQMMISPNTLDSTLHINSYNIGMNGWQFHMQYARFRVYMQHHTKPRYIVQVIDMPLFNDRGDLFESSQFIPYLNDTIIRNVTSQYNGHFTNAERYIPLFKYNQHFNLIAEGIRCFFHPPNADLKYKGYNPWTLIWDKKFDKLEEAYPDGLKMNMQQRVINEYDAYLRYCRDSNIKVIMVYTPVLYAKMPMIRNASEVMNIFTTLSRKYSVPLIDDSNDSLSLHRNYFFNSMHMNKTGAEIFSHTLAGQLQQFITPTPQQ